VLKYDIPPLCQAAEFGYALYPIEELIMCVIAFVYLMEMFSLYFSQDILVFLTGQEEIEAMARSIRLIVKVRPATRDI
jgi:HrpA-like RNA helicase